MDGICRVRKKKTQWWDLAFLLNVTKEYLGKNGSEGGTETNCSTFSVPRIVYMLFVQQWVLSS